MAGDYRAPLPICKIASAATRHAIQNLTMVSSVALAGTGWDLPTMH